MSASSEPLPVSEAAPVKGCWRNEVTLAFTGIVDASDRLFRLLRNAAGGCCHRAGRARCTDELHAYRYVPAQGAR